MKKNIISPVESPILPKKNIPTVYPMINITNVHIKKNTEMITEIIIIIKKGKDILLIIINMNLNMREEVEVEVDIVQKDIKAEVRENIVEIAVVGVGVEEVEIIMNQDRIIIIIIIIIYIIKIIAEIKKQIIIINQRKEIIKKKEDV